MRLEALCILAFGFTLFVQNQTQREYPTTTPPSVQVFVDKKDVEKAIKDIIKEQSNEVSNKE